MEFLGSICKVFWVQVAVFFVGFCLALIVSPFRLPFDNFINGLAFTFRAHHSELIATQHVRRVVIANLLHPIVGVPADEYTIVYGVRGCGKTQAVLEATEGACGVMRVHIANDKPQLSLEIVKRMWLPRDISVATVDGVLDVLKHTTMLMRWTHCTETVPTLVVEIEAGTHADVIYNLFHEIKILCVDVGVCHAIVVLSDATAVYALPNDFGRQDFVFLDDMTEDEAHEMLLKRGETNKDVRAQMMSKVGTRATYLISVLKRWSVPVELRKWIDYNAEKASYMVKDLLFDDNHGTAVLGIFRSIITSDTTPRQVRLDALDEVSALFGVPKRLAELMKKKNAHVLMYHPDERSYRFMSVFHERAAIHLLQQSLNLKKAENSNLPQLL